MKNEYKIGDKVYFNDHTDKVFKIIHIYNNEEEVKLRGKQEVIYHVPLKFIKPIGEKGE